MEEKSTIINLPIVPYNQSKHSDVCQYLEYLQRLITDIYAEFHEGNSEEAGTVECVPLYGDQLGRERITGAKKTRMGCDLPSERYSQLLYVTAATECVLAIVLLQA